MNLSPCPVAEPLQANLDFQCRQLKLGLRPTDLVRELTVSFFCPLQFSRECMYLLLLLEPVQFTGRKGHSFEVLKLSLRVALIVSGKVVARARRVRRTE